MTRRVTIIRESGETLAFDAWIAGSLSGAATITEHPIEDGSFTSDHSQAEPRQIDLQVRQSENPLEDDGGPFGEERIQETIEFLEEIGRSGESVDVEIPRIGIVSDQVLRRWPSAFDVRRSADFEISFREVEIAGVEIVQVPIEAIEPPARAGWSAEVDTGSQPTDEGTPSDEVTNDPESWEDGVRESLLKQFFG